MRKTISPLEKFLRNVNIGKDDECWGWLGRLTKYGAGLFTIEHTVDGQRVVETYFANRFSYEHYTGNKITSRYLDNICDRRDCCNPSHMRQRDFDARFWDNVDRTGDCWLWKGNVDRFTGYGYITIDHKSVSTHRLAYEVYYNKKVPDGLMVLHSCNTRRCINPKHLREGTHLDNMKDMIECGHSCKGEKNGNAILTEMEVKEIKSHFLTRDLSQSKIAEKFGISISTVKDIASGRCWNWVNVAQELL